MTVVDTFGAPRADTGWHHGDDLFAPRGTPVVAVADGVVFSRGWQRLGGRRLWLRDATGNEFYYAHLERYARRARDGVPVKRGDLLGFVGSSGDAEQTPPHLHFEIHPASLLGLGSDGAVDPTRYLRAWPHVRPRAIARPTRQPLTSCGAMRR
jgi:murein DD-endopeptidase MepM/ murein hydrolase activator NlpD